MNQLPGNPHFAEASKHRPQLVTEETANEGYIAEEGITDETMQFSALNRIAEATLALAYEQRTANMIAAANTLGFGRAQLAERFGKATQ